MGNKARNFKVGENIGLLIKNADGASESIRAAKKRGHIVEITSRFIVVQHKDYRECYLKSDFTTGRLKAIQRSDDLSTK